jgi:1,4-alpha-glucan branching enzyme
MITKEYLAQGSKIRVTFALPSTVPADQISVVGDFSDWDPTLSMDRAQPSGNWELTLDLPTGRRYRFRYLIDGQHWLNDIFADDHLENPYGSYDSVIDLRESVRQRMKQ